MDIYIIDTIGENNYYTEAKKILHFLYVDKFGEKKISLINRIAFWSSFVNKKYLLVIDGYNDMEILRKEIELFAGFKLEDCAKEYAVYSNL
jgi:hypothetical protein